MTIEETRSAPVPNEQLQAFQEYGRTQSDLLRTEYRHERNISVGSHPRQVLDVYYPRMAITSAPVFVWFHGGGFRQGSPDRVAYVGRQLLEAGCIFIAAGYRLAPEVLFPDNVEDVNLALRWVVDNIAERGGDPQRLFLGGHSAGATLVTHATLLGASGPDGVTASIKGLVLGSGGLMQAGEDRRAPVNDASPWFVAEPDKLVWQLPPHTIIYTGGAETGLMAEAAVWLADELRRRGASVDYYVVADKNHNESVDGMRSPDQPMYQAIERLIHQD